MGDKGGWTVADTARIKKRSTTTPTSASSLPVKPAPFFPAAVSPTSVSSSSSAAGGLDLQSRNGVGGQSSFGREGGQQQQQQQQVLLPSPLTATSPTPSKVSSTSKDNHVRWSDSFRTKSEEDLDKLLDGLEELTETLPDLNRSNNRVVKKQLFHSIPDSDSVDKAFNATFSANHNNNHSTNRSNRGVTGAALPSPVSQPNINSASSGYSSSATAVVRDSSNQHTRQPSPPHQSAYQLKQQELQQLQKQQIELQEQLRIQREQNQLREQEQQLQQQQQQRLPEPSVRINLPSSSHESDFDFSSPSTDPSQNPNGPVFPNVKKTRQLLQSRDTYNNSAGSVYSYAGSGTMESNGGGGASTSVSSPGMRQPYHTMQDSKPFSYIHINGGGGGGANNGSRPPSRTMSRASSREALSHGAPGLESPSLLRKIMGVGTGQNSAYEDSASSRPESPALSTVSSVVRTVPIKMSSSVSFQVGDQTDQKKKEEDEISTTTDNNNILSFHSAYDTTVSDDEATMTWLERQQKKLNSRREIERRRLGGGPGKPAGTTNGGGTTSSGDVMQELKSSLQRARAEVAANTKTTVTTTDGYSSDLNSMTYSDQQTPREKSPSKYQQQQKPTYNIPLKVESGYRPASPATQQSSTTTPKQVPIQVQVQPHFQPSSTSSQSHQEQQQQQTLYQHQPQQQPVYQQQPQQLYSSHKQQQQKDQHYKTTMSMTIGGHGHHHHQSRVDPNDIEALYTAQQQQQQSKTMPRQQLSAQPQQQQYHHQYPEQQQQQQHQEKQYNQIQTSGVSLSRQKSDTSYDRTRPFISRRHRYDSESENEQLINDFMMRHGTNLGSSRNNGFNASNTSIDSALQFGSSFSQGGSRPITPAFPQVPGTPYFNQSGAGGGYHHGTNGRSHSLTRNGGSSLLHHRSHSPAGGSLYQGHGSNGLDQRRGSVSSEPQEVSPIHVKLVKDNYKFWYKPNISREDAINMLQHRSAGTFVVRDSNSFPGAFGLALKVATPPAQSKSGGESNELVRHFLIEPTSKGVKLKGYNNEPVFASLSALVYQHTLTQLALPTRLVLPKTDLVLGGGANGHSHRDSIDSRVSSGSQMQQLLQLGAACNVSYLFTMDTDTLTGPAAVKKTISQALMLEPKPGPVLVHFKVSGQGITLTDQSRKLFFRKHYNTNTISFCGMDPDDRRWSEKFRIFGYVAKKPTSKTQNQCHVFAEHDPEQPARAIVNFVNKVMLSGASGGSGNSNGGIRTDVV